jgi:hypothetical protein
MSLSPTGIDSHIERVLTCRSIVAYAVSLRQRALSLELLELWKALASS